MWIVGYSFLFFFLIFWISICYDWFIEQIEMDELLNLLNGIPTGDDEMLWPHNNGTSSNGSFFQCFYLPDMLLYTSRCCTSGIMLALSRMRCFLCQKVHFFLLDSWRLLVLQLEWQLQVICLVTLGALFILFDSLACIFMLIVIRITLETQVMDFSNICPKLEDFAFITEIYPN